MSEVKKYGIYCNAALAINPKCPPRYTSDCMVEAEMLQQKANAECASECQHPIKKIKP